MSAINHHQYDILPLKPIGAVDNGRMVIDRGITAYRQKTEKAFAQLLEEDPALAAELHRMPPDEQRMIKQHVADTIDMSEMNYLSGEHLASRVAAEIRLYRSAVREEAFAATVDSGDSRAVAVCH